MFERIEVVRMARAMGQHTAQRQAIVAQNIANADTPGYRAQDVERFSDSYRRQDLSPLRVSSARHLAIPDWSPASARIDQQQTEISPNGNSVSLEAEMLKAAEVKRSHELSLGIYRSALELMRTSIARR